MRAADLPAAGDTTPATAPAEAQRRKAQLKWVFKALVAAGILYLLFTQVDLAGVWAAMREASPAWIVAAFATMLLMHLTVADRLRRLISVQGVELSLWEVFEINLSTLFYGLFLPGGNFTGIAIRFYRLSSTNKSMLNTGVALFLDRIVATLTLLIFGIGFWLLERPIGGMFALWVMLAASAGLALLIVGVFAPADVPVVGTLQRVMRRFGGAKINKLCDAMQSQWHVPKRTMLLIFTMSLSSHLFGAVAYWMVARAMGFELGFVAAAWIRSAMILATMIPLTPSGVGLREGASLKLLAIYGIAAEQAIAFSLVIFGATVVGVALVGGLFEAVRLRK